MSRPNNSDIIGRIRHLMQSSQLSQAAFARRIGLDPSNVSKYLCERLPINDTLLNRIIVNMGVSPSWLKNGIGLPYEKRLTIHPAGNADIQTESATQSRNQEAIPLYDIDVAAGTACHQRMFTEENLRGHLYLPELNPNWVAVRAKGDSMQPIIGNGAYICLLPVNEKDNIIWGDIYVVVTEKRRVVKYVRRNDDPSQITLKSANPEYDPIEIPLDNIIALYPVKAIVNLNICL